MLASASESEVAIFVPVADTYTRSDRPDENYGSAPRISAMRRGDETRKAYLRFDVEVPDDRSVERATLLLFARSGASDAGVAAKPVPNGWRESALTWSNAPPPSGDPVASASGYSDESWISLDVTPLVSGSGEVSFVLESESEAWHGFRSRENDASTPPQLRVEWEGAEREESTAPEARRRPETEGGSSSPGEERRKTAVRERGRRTTIVAAGDVACPGVCGQDATASLIARLDPDAVLGLGDYQYDEGTTDLFDRYYDPYWGRFKSRTYAINGGSHDFYGTGDYLEYFNDGGPVNLAPEGSYSFDLGRWHLVALNSYCFQRPSCDRDRWTDWLEDDLEKRSRKCTLAYFHEPYWTTPSEHERDTSTRSWVELLYRHGVDVVLQAHNHVYERFRPQTPDDEVDTERGLVAITVGTGGRSHYGFSGDAARNSVVRNDDTYGVLEMVLRPRGYEFEFVPVPGGSFTDSGTGRCH